MPDIGGVQGAAAPPPPAPPPPPPLPTSGRVTLHNVTIGPGKVDGTQWDGPGRVEPNEIRRLSRALALPNPCAEVLSILADPVTQALEKPEVVGEAWLVTASGRDRGVSLSAQRDTFTPQFAGPPTWSGVPLDGSTRLDVSLTDRDLMFDDPIGSFQLNQNDLIYALRAGRVVQIRVHDQTGRQVLFAAISVIAE